MTILFSSNQFCLRARDLNDYIFENFVLNCQVLFIPKKADSAKFQGKRELFFSEKIKRLFNEARPNLIRFISAR